MNCSKCGALNADDAAFCSLCSEVFKPPKKIPEDKSEDIKKEDEKKASDSRKSARAKESPPGYGIKADPLNSEGKQKKTKTGAGKDKKSDAHVHSSPGFNIEVNKQPKSTTDSPPLKANEESKPAVKKREFAFTKWLFPAILATIISLVFFLLFPNLNKITGIAINLPITKILIIAILLGAIVSAGGIVQLNLRAFTTGWLLGLSSGFLSFNIMFFGGFMLQKLSSNLFSRLIGSEMIIISALLGMSIILFIMVEKLSYKMLSIYGFAVFFLFVIIGAISIKWVLPLPVISFLAWPIGYYLLQWQTNRTTEKPATS